MSRSSYMAPPKARDMSHDIELVNPVVDFEATGD
jgi:hypothetical protein